MLRVEQALTQILERAAALAPRTLSLSEALGLVLAQDVVSDIDSPPHDKSVVDGYAVIAADCAGGGAELAVLEEVTAGKLPTRGLAAGKATKIMTGAPLPAGADAVVMVEQTEARSGGTVRIVQREVKAGQNIMRQAASLARGQKALTAGQPLRGIELGLLAEVGCTEARVIPRPSAAIVATGNELVPPAAKPGAGQIRNSNGTLLFGLVTQAGGLPVDLGIAVDEEQALAERIEAGLAYDVLLLSGGVSAGVLDLVPSVLERLGVWPVFHKVDVKPGKPLWFGVKERSGRPPVLVFGLPGNPVSTLVCFELFVRPALARLAGRGAEGLRSGRGVLTREHRQRGERPTYWPARWAEQGVTPLAWQGSGDLRTLTEANCLACFPGGDRVFAVGDEIEVLWLPGE